MSEVINYKHIALNWQPEGESSRLFSRILILALAFALGLAYVISQVKVPVTPWEQRAKVPDRIANFINQKPKKIEKPVEIPKPRPAPLPKPVQKPEQSKANVTVSRTSPGDIQQKPLTDAEKVARSTAQQSGLLALAAEMDSLRDTTAVNENVRARLSTEAPMQEATHKVDALKADMAKIGQSSYQEKLTAQVQATDLQSREAKATTTITEQTEIADAQNKASSSGRGSSDVGLVFNKNKSSLYALYERERRKNSGLKGRIVFQLTIEPSGKVSNVKIVSSELNNAELENRLLARIKLFVFAPAEGGAVTVSYPIEFIPS